MKITKPGVLPLKKVEVLTGTCSKCHCEVEANINDQAIFPYSRTEPEFKVYCPTKDCGNIIILHLALGHVVVYGNPANPLNS